MYDVSQIRTQVPAQNELQVQVVARDCWTSVTFSLCLCNFGDIVFMATY